MANLGDGNGPQPQIFELREDFGNVETGVCIEQLIGGNHFRSVWVADPSCACLLSGALHRVYRQNGKLANSGALFLA